MTYRNTRTRSALPIVAALVLALALLLPQTSHAAATTNIYAIEGAIDGTVNATSANLRADPSTRYAAVGTAKKGTALRVTGYAQPAASPNGFFEVANGSGRAYIAANLLDVSGLSLAAVISSPGYAYRSRSASSAERAFSVSGTDAVTLTQRSGAWWRATVGGQSVWLQTKIVKPSGTAAATVDASQPKTSGGTLAFALIPSSVTTPEGRITVTAVGTEGATFVGYRPSSEGAVYTDVAGFYNITADKQFTVTADGWYTAARINADGTITYASIEINNVQPTPSGMRYDYPAGYPYGAYDAWGSGTMTIYVGDSVQLSAPTSTRYSGLTWSTSDNGVATVSSSGVVRGIRPGRATISVTLDGRWVESCLVTVLGPRGETTSISISSWERAKKGTSFTLSPSISPSNTSYTSLTWTSSNPTVASVNANGVVTCHQVGNATILVAMITPSGGIYTARCAVEVVSN